MNMSSIIDDPANNDNRNYHYGEDFYDRHEFSTIKEWTMNNSKIIDLGCGNGALMNYLKKTTSDIIGIEISPSGVEQCLKNGLKTICAAIDNQLTYTSYLDNQFDYAICNVTMQMVDYPEVLIQEMKRISKYQIISFPNFAYLENRLDLLFNGVMPRKMLYGYKWYSTGHIHQFSIVDFKNFCKENGIEIIKRRDYGCFSFVSQFFWPNLLSKESMFLCKKI